MYFVCRDRVDSPYSKSVFALQGVTVLEWFQREWRNPDAEDTIGGGAYGLESIFEAVQEHDLPVPATLQELHATLDEHLWIESDDPLRLDERGLRVRTNDDEVDLAYYFLEDAAVAAEPSRLAYLINEAWPLPSGAVDAAAAGVYVVRNSWQHWNGVHTNLDLEGAAHLPGVLMPDLPAHLLATDDEEAGRWPEDARLLRNLVADGDADLGPALRRYSSLAGYDVRGWGGHEVPAREKIAEWAAAGPDGRSLVHVGPHLAQADRYIDDFFGFDQLIVFDTCWAGAHPDLAASLLRYAAHWDPFD